MRDEGKEAALQTGLLFVSEQAERNGVGEEVEAEQMFDRFTGHGAARDQPLADERAEAHSFRRALVFQALHCNRNGRRGRHKDGRTIIIVVGFFTVKRLGLVRAFVCVVVEHV